jgi:hypothetical protein
MRSDVRHARFAEPYKAPEQLHIEAVDLLLERAFIAQACQLIHCLIERVAYLNMPDKKSENDSTDYVEIVDKYIMPRLGSVPYTARDLAGQRCGTIHSLTHRGQGKKGKEQANFKWKFRDYGVSCTDPIDSQETVVTDLEKFWLAVKQGVQEFFRQHAGKWTTIQSERYKKTMEYARLIPDHEQQATGFAD